MKKILTVPIRDEDIDGLRAGDVIYLTGTIATGRDDVHRRVVAEGMQSPFDLRGGVIFHAGPIVRRTPAGNELVAVGPTSSVRMEAFQAGFIEKTGVRVIIGKGGMGPATAQACRQFKAVHCVAMGGCAVSAASQVEAIQDCFWPELGMPECMWVLRVREFGPLVVSIDAHGGDLFAATRADIAGRREACQGPIVDSVKDYMVVD